MTQACIRTWKRGRLTVGLRLAWTTTVSSKSSWVTEWEAASRKERKCDSYNPAMLQKSRNNKNKKAFLHKWQQMLRIWGKRNLNLLLMGVLTNAANMEISMEISQKRKKIELSYDPDIWLLGMYPRDSTSYLRDLPIHTYCCSIYNSKVMGSA